MRESMPLDSSEEEVYRLLVGLAQATVAQLAGVSGMSVDDADDVLRRLLAKGLVVAQEPGPVFRALPPDVALGATLLRRQESLDAARAMVAALSEEFRAGASRHDAHHAVEVVVGAVALRDRLRALQNSAKEEILWFCRANPLAMQGSDNTEELDALRRGVRYRAIYERSLLEQPGELDSVLEGIGWGEEARVSPALPVRLAIVDRRTAICPLTHDQERHLGVPTAAVIGSGQLLDALLDLFEGHWERASVLHGDGWTATDETAPEATIGAPERLLLSLLVAGVPDKSIVTQLGISRRTVQRRFDRLMALAGVDTRTALAYQAARRGWL
ncbi:helix-turn-helix domain-containing protein [Aeromicrobium chenweiae]|uniref:TrmB family transcriptional regulator n=1 Tax=Aeromicrobium chenweiae TaxID=2079793 RepID=A0A2S0WJ42_9ACTN|nr:helix-turn-helix domain-containing protein [Aeromicrobium chenweiae]AWB91361.1 TrmB family transcriptional regulator [Aeromicrobium chenweiae]TGN30706.1 TrmB family transcriptional regulator [Aeromicrobium chenweiae]